MEVIMKVLNGNAVSSVISEKMCGQTNKHTNKQTDKQDKNSIVTGTGDYKNEDNICITGTEISGLT